MAEGPVSYLLNKLSSLLENELQACSNIQQEVIHVRDELNRIKAFLRTADSLTEQDHEVRVWVEQIRDNAYCIEDILDELNLISVQDADQYTHQGLLSKVSGNLRSMKARYRIVCEFKRISSRMKSICEVTKRLRHKFNQSGYCDIDQNVSYEHRGDAELAESADVVGVDEPKRQLVAWLTGGSMDREVVPIVGMGGLGKTTLAKQVYHDPAVKKNFQCRVQVTLSPSLHTEELLKDMLKQISRQVRKPTPRKTADTSNRDWLKMMIKSMLLNKRYLILLDDIWHVDKWDAVKYAFPNDKCGSRLMLTTRNIDVASASCLDFGGKVYELQPLSEEESWKLFCRKTFDGDDYSCPAQLEEISKFIMRKCEGLPLPIMAISGVLASRDTRKVGEWDLVRRCLRAEIEGDDRLRKINKVLSLSYDDLPYYLKSCFLYMSVFPEGHVIKRMRLIRLWVAEGFVEAKEGRTLEEAANDYLNELLNRSLLQVVKRATDGRVKLCRIHHLLQQIAIGKAKDQNFTARVDEETDSGSLSPVTARRLSIHGKFNPSGKILSCSRLRSLFTSGMDKQSAKAAVLCAPKLLTVLDMQAVPLRKFPVHVIDMYSLRYLSFRCSEVRSVPSSIGNLQNLETLDLKHTYVTELPVQIVKLQRLRHLLVYRYETRSFSQTKYGFKTLADVGRLQSLQKLCYIDAADERSSIILRGIGKLTQLRRLCIVRLKKEDGVHLCLSIAKLTNLCALSLYSLEKDEVLDLHDLASPPPSLQRVYLKGRLLALPHWIPGLSSLLKLHLRQCRLKDDPLLSLQNLPNLAHLELQEVCDWNVLRFHAKGFKKLKYLGLDEFPQLRSIHIEDGALPYLIRLTIQRCKLLQEVPWGVEHLTMIKLLEFFDVHDELVRKLKLEDQSEDYRRVAHVQEVRYGSSTDGSWEVKSLERISASSSHSREGESRSDLPPHCK
ncbi:hypothetical protein SAY86_011217 [Trapa natans]|uniref:Disease resistance protein RPM1-like n=1 Tax=Trapa natans TaxID=22666 RepID=A0AAN7R0M3_TRANT|nr:hypothetical protein SAY86_011217 [Trapa natans]